MASYFSTLKPLITLVVILILFSCENKSLVIDVSDINVSLNLKRFDQDLFAYPEGITAENVIELNTNYGVFFEDFTQIVISLGPSKKSKLYRELNDFSKNYYIDKLKVDTDKTYTDFSSYETQLTDAFKHYAHYFPKKKIPELITYISGLNYAITTDESYLGIGLDMFLGSDYPAYAQLSLPQYKTAMMRKENLVSGAMIAWISTEFELQEKNADLLTEMIHQGKTLYLLDALMPEADNTVKISYSEEQLKWCHKNEEPVWYYFIDNDLLYTKETKKIIKYMGESPFINGFPEGSPGRIGHWLGWQIVKAYMKNNPEITIEKLMLNNNAQQLLNASKYKP